MHVMGVAYKRDIDDCVVILTDQSAFDYQGLVRRSRLIVDPHNARRRMTSEKSCCCNPGFRNRRTWENDFPGFMFARQLA